MRKAKVAFAMVLALLVVSSVGASGASANFTSDAPSGSTIVTGEQDTQTVMTFDTGNTTCKNVHFHGIMNGSHSSVIHLTPTYSECTMFGFNATVTMNGCTYTWTTTGIVHLTCPSGKNVVIDTAFNSCNVTILPQEGLSKITFTTGLISGKHDLTVDSLISNTKYTESGFACAASGKATTGGSLTGSLTLTGIDFITGQRVNLTHHQEHA